MNCKSGYSFSCAAFAALVVVGSVGGCFSERVAGPPAAGAGDLCAAGNTQPNVVRIRNFAFSPAELRVKPGTRVIFANCDGVQHTSTSDTDLWDSGLISPATTYERVYGEAGRFPYHCEPHPSMAGTVVVE